MRRVKGPGRARTTFRRRLISHRPRHVCALLLRGPRRRCTGLPCCGARRLRIRLRPRRCPARRRSLPPRPPLRLRFHRLSPACLMLPPRHPTPLLQHTSSGRCSVPRFRVSCSCWSKSGSHPPHATSPPTPRRSCPRCPPIRPRLCLLARCGSRPSLIRWPSALAIWSWARSSARAAWAPSSAATGWARSLRSRWSASPVRPHAGPRRCSARLPC
mmetsp:Transcript_16441/g.53607  ORF Transcript_16441/g.53607 Transcript_16441/m.53607 type:complete len:215 (+) Transcript_16441:558-1202(+)